MIHITHKFGCLTFDLYLDLLTWSHVPMTELDHLPTACSPWIYANVDQSLTDQSRTSFLCFTNYICIVKYSNKLIRKVQWLHRKESSPLLCIHTMKTYSSKLFWIVPSSNLFLPLHCILAITSPFLTTSTSSNVEWPGRKNSIIL